MKTEDIKIRSEEVQEILTRTPNWTLRVGSSLFLLVLLVVLFLSWFIKYPNVIESEIYITTKIPPQKEYAQGFGRVDSIYVNDSQQVKKGQVLAVLENEAKTEHVLYVKSILDTLSFVSSSSFTSDRLPMLFLGEVQDSFSNFMKEYETFLSSNPRSKPNGILLNVFAKTQWSNQNKVKPLHSLMESFLTLKRDIEIWERKYVLVSRLDGKIVFGNLLGTGQTVNQGDIMLTIVPIHQLDYVGKLMAPIRNSGKIRIGQEVNIKLDNYPDAEFGILRGKIKHIASIPDDAGFYMVDVELPRRLITSYNQEVDFRYGTSGKAEIITEKLRLTERIFYQFKKLIN